MRGGQERREREAGGVYGEAADDVKGRMEARGGVWIPPSGGVARLHEEIEEMTLRFDPRRHGSGLGASAPVSGYMAAILNVNRRSVANRAPNISKRTGSEE